MLGRWQLSDGFGRTDLKGLRIWKIFSCIDIKAKSMTSASFCKGSLDGFVDVRTLDIIQEYGLVSGIHDRKVFDVFKALDGYSNFDPAGFPIREIVPAVWTFIDGVDGFREVGLDNLPSPCPGEIGEVALLFRVLVAVDRIERRKNGLWHRQ